MGLHQRGNANAGSPKRYYISQIYKVRIRMPCLLFLDEQIYTKVENHCIMLCVLQNTIVLNFARKVKSDLSPLDSQNLGLPHNFSQQLPIYHDYCVCLLNIISQL